MLTNQQASSLRRQIQTSNVATHRARLERAGLLYKASMETVQPKGSTNAVALFAYWGFTSWEDYVRQEVGICKKTSLVYINTYAFWCVTLREGKNWKESPVALDKMTMLVPVIRNTPKAADQWLKRAASMTSNELRVLLMTGKLLSYIARIQAAGPRPRVDGVHQTLSSIKVHPKSQYSGRFDILESALILALSTLNAGGTLP